MEVISSYLENMFLNLPHTPEVIRAKKELASMMEDKYNELLAEGKKKNEAIGIVISEFGDLEELAQELGFDYRTAGNYEKNTDYSTVGRYKENDGSKKDFRIVSRQEAEEYITMSEKTSKWIAVGVILCIWSPILLLFWGGVDESVKKLSDFSLILLGVVPLFIMVGIAVAIFIYNGMKMEKYEYLKKECIQIEHDLEAELTELQEKVNPVFTIKIVIGVVLCIFSVIPPLLFGSTSGSSVLHSIGVIIFLVIVGIAVALFITGGIKKECIHVLKQEGEFSSGKKEGKKITEVIAGIYWPIVTLIYLSWSFITGNWGFTWIIWVIAGITFGVISEVCETGASIKG